MPAFERKQRGGSLGTLVTRLRRVTGEFWPRSETIGSTPLLRARGLEERFRHELRARAGVHFTGRIWLKHEGANCTSTHKDRAATAHVSQAIALGKNEITIASCGNAGEALAVAAALRALSCTIFIPEAYLQDPQCAQAVQRMRHCGAKVELTEGDYDYAVKCSERHALRDKCYDANSSGPNLEVEHRAYAEIIRESVSQLRDEGPEVRTELTAVAAPLGNGALFTGLYFGVKLLQRDGLIAHLPQMIGGTCMANNPILEAARHRQKDIEPLQSCRVTSATAPLATRNPCDAVNALDAIRCTNGGVYHVNDNSLSEVCNWLKATNPLQGWNLDPLKAGVAGLEALFEGLQKGRISPDGTYVVIISGVKD